MSAGTTTDLGTRFATSLAAKDSDALTALLTPDVDFLGLTPRRMWEAHAPEEVLEVLWTWFGEEDRIDALHAVSSGEPVEDTEHVEYRLTVVTPDGPHTVAQQAYYRTDGDRIAYLRVMCSGFRPRGAGVR